MSQENVEIVLAAYDAYNRGDLNAALKDTAADSELDWSRAVGPQRGVYKLDQMRAFFDDFADTFESIRVEPDEFIDAGEQVVVPQTGYIRGTRWNRGDGPHHPGVDSPRWCDRADMPLSRKAGGPRSRRAQGVGDQSPA